MTYYISLSASIGGFACAVADSIINNIGKKETHFFDWTICSIKSINEVIMEEEILFEESYDPTHSFCVVNFKKFDKLISVHDFHFSDFDNTEKINNKIIEITNKYNRRRERFFKTIREQTNIFFLRYCYSNEDFDSEQIYLFIQNILNINNNLEFYLVIITTINDLNIPQYISEYIILINLNYESEFLSTNNSYDEIIKLYEYIYPILSKPISELIYSNYFPADNMMD